MKISKLFRREGGFTFEKELSQVIYSIAAQISNQEVEKNNTQILKTINIGSKTANIASSENLEELII